MLFKMIISYLIFQRILELRLAKRNESWMKKQGAYEVGRSHYKYFVLLHIAFILSLTGEVIWYQKGVIDAWPFFLACFLLTQLVRLWVLRSLGRFWNTRILILPGASVVRRGPYQWLRHPNYVVVVLELILIPLIFKAYVTAILFTLLKMALLSIRIPMEEKALRDVTNYEQVFK